MRPIRFPIWHSYTKWWEPKDQLAIVDGWLMKLTEPYVCMYVNGGGHSRDGDRSGELHNYWGSHIQMGIDVMCGNDGKFRLATNTMSYCQFVVNQGVSFGYNWILPDPKSINSKIKNTKLSISSLAWMELTIVCCRFSFEN